MTQAAVGGLALVIAIVLAMVAAIEIGNLQTTGESEGGAVGSFFGFLMSSWVLITAGVAVVALMGFLAAALRR